jgi:hypothetical protein
VKAEKTAIKKGLQRWFKKKRVGAIKEKEKKNKNLNFTRGPNRI